RREDGHLHGSITHHDLRIFFIRWLPSHLSGEGADVVDDEPVHRGLLARIIRRVVRSHYARERHETVAGVLDAEKVSVDVRVFLAGVWMGRIHVGRYAVRDELAVCSVPSPLRNGVL